MKPYSAIFLFVCAHAVSTWADAPDSTKSDSIDGATREELVAMRRDIKPSALRALLEDLRASSGSRFPKAAAYSARLNDIEKEISRADELTIRSEFGTAVIDCRRFLNEAAYRAGVFGCMAQFSPAVPRRKRQKPSNV